MLSILIPTYNYVCAHLVCELQKQCEEAQALLGNDFAYEIIVADDCSTDGATIEKNGVIECLPHCRFETLDENLGRALVRNWLIAQARYEWCLLIDSDAEVVHDSFIRDYLAEIEAVDGMTDMKTDGSLPATRNDEYQTCTPSVDIVIGGITTPLTAPPGCELRHRYELAATRVRTLEVRRSRPEAFFSTFNVLIHKRVFDVVQFDARCSQYGYEDAYFGIQAATCGFRIHHIDNPLQHNGINDNASFVANSEAALRNLHMLGEPMISHARVSQTATRLGQWRKPIVILYRLLRPLLLVNLRSSHPNLKVFAFYKLGYFLSL